MWIPTGDVRLLRLLLSDWTPGLWRPPGIPFRWIFGGLQKHQHREVLADTNLRHRPSFQTRFCEQGHNHRSRNTLSIPKRRVGDIAPERWEWTLSKSGLEAWAWVPQTASVQRLPGYKVRTAARLLPAGPTVQPPSLGWRPGFGGAASRSPHWWGYLRPQRSGKALHSPAVWFCGQWPHLSEFADTTGWLCRSSKHTDAGISL